MVVLAGLLDRLLAQDLHEVEDGAGGAHDLAAARESPAGSSPKRRATRSKTASRTAVHASRTAPPVMYVWREAELDPASPMLVSAGWIVTRSTPSSVRAICWCTVISPWPTSAAAVWTSATGAPPITSRRTRAVE